MEPFALYLRRNLENLGLQLLFAPIRSLVGVELPKEIPLKKKQALVNLKSFLDTAITGIELKRTRQKKRPPLLIASDEKIKAERAYQAISSILPWDLEEAKEKLQEIRAIVEQILNGKPLPDNDREKLHSFCREVLGYLDQEYFKYLRDPQNVWP